jgi:hypothetical protein
VVEALQTPKDQRRMMAILGVLAAVQAQQLVQAVQAELGLPIKALLEAQHLVVQPIQMQNLAQVGVELEPQEQMQLLQTLAMLEVQV